LSRGANVPKTFYRIEFQEQPALTLPACYKGADGKIHQKSPGDERKYLVLYLHNSLKLPSAIDESCKVPGNLPLLA
jgi:hypothetical protein